MKATYRQCLNFSNAAEQLKGRGGFEFRCAVAAIAMETTKQIEIFNAGRKPVKGMQEYQEEVNLHRENCTITKNEKKEVNVAAFIPLRNKANATHAKAIAEHEKINAEANAQLDKAIELTIIPVAISLLKEADKEEHFEVSILSRLLSFVEK